MLLDIFATYSVDGGQNWAPAFQVNDPNNPFDPDFPNNQRRFPTPQVTPCDATPGSTETCRIGEYFAIDLFGLGDDDLRGNQGSDTYIFAGLFGDDTIWTFTNEVDLLDISAFSSFLTGGFGDLDTNNDGIFSAEDDRGSFSKGQLVADLTFGGGLTGGTIALHGVDQLTAGSVLV